MCKCVNVLVADASKINELTNSNSFEYLIKLKAKTKN